MTRLELLSRTPSWPARTRAPLGLQDARERWGEMLEARLLRARAGGALGGMMEYQLRTGGKRLRLLLPSTVCHNLGGDGHDALDLGVALELLHQASVVHDDCQDRDSHRRGVPTVWARWGEAQAINVGDALLFRAFGEVAKSPIGAQALPVISDAMVHLTEGQTMDLRLQELKGLRQSAFLSAWFQMAEGKTAAFFALGMELGAMAAGASDEVRAEAADYGRQLGLLFQVQDDLLDVLGGKGRERGGDIVVGKLSWLVAWAYDHGDAEKVARLRQLVNKHADGTTEADVEEAIALLHELGAVEAAIAWLCEAKERAAAHPMRDAVPDLAARMLAAVDALCAGEVR